MLKNFHHFFADADETMISRLLQEMLSVLRERTPVGPYLDAFAGDPLIMHEALSDALPHLVCHIEV